jgi:tRNA (cytidine/uridine-2'-O-)-methyltransferase
MSDPLFHIVLLRPEIPNNTGNIGRTAMVTGCRLHVVHPAAFDLSEKACRRAGLDYWPHVDCVQHAGWEEFLTTENPPRLWLFTTQGSRVYWDASFQRGDYMLFGNETSGVPDAVHQWVADRFGASNRLNLPMIDAPAARSLNLATAVCAAVYEGWRQTVQRPPRPLQ